MTIWRHVQCFSLLAIVLLVHQPVAALDVSWIADPNVPGNWNDPNNWDIAGGPLSTDKAIISNGGTAQVTDLQQIAGLNVAQNGSPGGTLEIHPGGTLINTQVLQVGNSTSGDGTITLSGGDYFGGLTNDFIGANGTGRIEVTAGTWTGGGAGLFLGNGGLGHGILDVSGTGTLKNHGLQLGFGASEATVNLTGDTASIIELRPVDTFFGGTVTFNLTPGPSGINPITITGTMSGGRLKLNGDNDTLNVDLSDYAFGSSTMVLFEFEQQDPNQALEDDFETVNITGGTATLVYDTSIFPREVRLENILPIGTPGDFDGDGDVDGADFLEWQRTDGTPGGLANWQGNYPPPLSAVSSVTAVPEPASVALTALGALNVACLSRRRRIVE